MSKIDVLRMVLGEALALGALRDAEADFLTKAGWISLGREAGTGIDSWTTIERGLANVVSREQALKLARFPLRGTEV